MRKSSLTLLGLLLIVLLAMAPVMAASAQITDVKVTDVKTAKGAPEHGQAAGFSEHFTKRQVSA